MRFIPFFFLSIQICNGVCLKCGSASTTHNTKFNIIKNIEFCCFVLYISLQQVYRTFILTFHRQSEWNLPLQYFKIMI